jgi:hypothetical protein
MSLHRLSLATLALALAVAAATFGWWTAGPSAHAAVAWNSATVPITGTVTGRPESVAFSGRVQIQSRLAIDPDAASRSKVLLQIDLGGVSGVGASTATPYAVAAREVVFRKLATSDVVRITFPFHPANSRAVTSSRTGVASFALTFDTATGAITSARAGIASPDFR